MGATGKEHQALHCRWLREGVWGPDTSSTFVCPGRHLRSLFPDAGESPNPRNEIKDKGEVAGQRGWSQCLPVLLYCHFYLPCIRTTLTSTLDTWGGLTASHGAFHVRIPPPGPSCGCRGAGEQVETAQVWSPHCLAQPAELGPHSEPCSRQDFSPRAQWSCLPYTCRVYRQLWLCNTNPLPFFPSGFG